MVAGRSGRSLSIKYDDIMRAMDWNRILIEAKGRHALVHPDNNEEVCGSCLRDVVLMDE